MVEPVESDARGLVDPNAGLRRFTLDRHAPSAAVARFVSHHWIVTWDLPPGQRHAQTVLPHPVVNLTVEAERATVTGVLRGSRTKVLEGRGRVLGVMFRPGGFRPLAPGPMTHLTDREAHLLDWFGPASARWADEVREASGQEVMVAAAEAFLAPRLPREPHPCEEAIRIVERIAADPSVRRVDQVAAQAGVAERTLQRLFAEHVGVSPKWVIRRYRVYEAAERAARGLDVTWAALAAELGYADQAHLTREFTAAFGVPPDRYARRQA